MGILNIFKRNKEAIKEVQEQKENPYEITYGTTVDGRLQVDFYDTQAKFNQFYDTTRLIANPNPIQMAGKEVYNCIVGWYNQTDCCILDEDTGNFSQLGATDYKGVLAEIDFDLLQNDPDYCTILMLGLLEKKRVTRYIDEGLKEQPEKLCGKYVGGVHKDDNGYRKVFSPEVGKASHYSKLMIDRRQRNAIQLEEQRQKSIADRKAQMERLQNEIKELEIE